MNGNLLSWGAFAVFVACALGLEWHDAMFRLDGPGGAAKVVVWAEFVLFVGYSLHCSTKENLFRSIASISRLHWGRQIGIDLYLGLGLSLSIIYLHQGPLAALLWLVPILLFANLATLLYVAIHFEALVSLLAR